MFTWIEWLLVAAIVAIIGAAGWSWWADSNAPTFELRKRDWTCTLSRQETRLRPQMVGKVIVQIPHTETVCDRWERIK